MALHKSHVNGATNVKPSHIGIGKYLGCIRIFSARGVRGAHGPLMYIWDPLSGTTGARKLELKTQLDVVKYLLWVQQFFC